MKINFFSLISALVILFAAPAFAGPQFIDDSGYAVSGYDVVSYWKLKQSEVGKPQASPLLGKKDITADYNGVKWAFSSAENRDEFLKDPAKYAPQFDGHCAYGVAKGGKVQANPNLWRIVDGKLYLNITKNVVGFWEEDIPGNISKAGKNWPGLQKSSSPNKNAPGFTPKEL
ncbi:MAG: YHS domain-containing (seleno)protein [Methyloligellaceae bacterium]